MKRKAMDQFVGKYCKIVTSELGEEKVHVVTGTITDIESIGTGELETTKQFYEICKQAHIEDKEFMIEMDGENIYIKKSMGSVMIWTSTSYFYLTKKNIEDILAKLE